MAPVSTGKELVYGCIKKEKDERWLITDLGVIGEVDGIQSRGAYSKRGKVMVGCCRNPRVSHQTGGQNARY
jgi:hypothetical protein